MMPLITMPPQLHRIPVTHPVPDSACAAVAAGAGISKAAAKRAMNQGAVWLQRGRRKMQRLRRATTALRPGDLLLFYHDPAILALTPPPARCAKDCRDYSIWFKPAGLLTQGTRFGDHCALLRQVERHFNGRRPALAVHRLDREASGLVLVAHHRTAAARLSDLLRSRAIVKTYRIQVLGRLGDRGATGRIDLALDGKSAGTDYTVLDYDGQTDRTRARIILHTGRLHQIRRHLAAIGHPVLGDPRYGQGNGHPEGLQLVADRLAFECPFGRGPIDIKI